MIVLAALVVVVYPAALVVGCALIINRAMRQVAVLDERERAERAVLLRAVLSRHSSDFAQLERAIQPKAPTPVMTRAQYEEDLRDQLEDMGYSPDAIPSVPEGL